MTEIPFKAVPAEPICVFFLNLECEVTDASILEVPAPMT